ncbi:MAG: DUF1302 domain-containing protein [Myxococcota bacterium]|nr:DUF1302 domain-containing protein [Myxococcota bacterium]
MRLGIALGLAICLAPAASSGRPWKIGEFVGVLDVSLAYGLLARVEERDPDLIGIGNGGDALSVNADDGNLNYGKGIVSNQLRGTAEFGVRWRNFGAFVRGFGFYDFETQISGTSRTGLSDDAKWLVGAGAELQDAYLTANWEPWGMPVQLRVGQQVVNWGESNFLRFGVDVVNPIDFLALAQPTSTFRDVFRRQGMIWGVANLTESVAVEAFYQYDWEPVGLAPIGWFISPDDLVGGDGAADAFEGLGLFSDQGTDLGEAFGATVPGGDSFDRDFMRIPKVGRNEPPDQGQFGFTVQGFFQELNGTKLALHFVNYHSRLPLVNGFTADASVAATTTDADVTATEAALGVSRADAETITISRLANGSRVGVSYPQNIRMLGLSFSTATIRTGTLFSGEVAHHFGWPIQRPREPLILATLSPVQYTGASAELLREASRELYGRVLRPDEFARGFTRTGKTQVTLAIAQLFGPRFGASQSVLSVDFGYVHVADLPGSNPFDQHSWGYRVLASLTYDSVFGGLSVRPRVLFSHDPHGTTPRPGGAFIEDRKTVVAGLGFQFTQSWTADVAYIGRFGGGQDNLLSDRDVVRFNLIFYY